MGIPDVRGKSKILVLVGLQLNRTVSSVHSLQRSAGQHVLQVKAKWKSQNITFGRATDQSNCIVRASSIEDCRWVSMCCRCLVKAKYCDLVSYALGRTIPD